MATAVDIAAITTLAALSGGPFSQARLAYFLVPVAVAFRFRPSVTAVAGAGSIAAYLGQAFAHPSASEPEATRFVLVQAGYLAWVSRPRRSCSRRCSADGPTASSSSPRSASA